MNRLPPRAMAIAEAVCASRGVALYDLLGRNQTKPVAHARFELMARLYSIKREDGQAVFSTPRIGSMLGLDHTTVVHGIKRFAEVYGDLAVDRSVCLFTRAAALEARIAALEAGLVSARAELDELQWRATAQPLLPLPLRRVA